MPRKKLVPQNTKQPMPLRLRPAYKARLLAVAAQFGISAGDWVESQLEPYMTKEKPPR